MDRNVKKLLLKAAVFGFGFIVLNSLLITHYSLHAAFKDTGWGVRPLGMGGAFTAVANDSNAQFYNPAGLSQVGQEELTFMSAKLFTGLDGVDINLNYLGFVYPMNVKYGTLGFAWAAMSTPSLYREDTVTLSYGRALDDVLRVYGANISLGFNAKYLKHEYELDKRTVNDPVFASGTAASASTADIGILVNFNRIGLNCGLMSKNITSPDVGLKTEDPVPNENVIGLSYYTKKVPYLALPYFTSALDIVQRDQNTDARVGVESWFFKGRFAVRVGGRMQEVTMGLGYEIEIMKDTQLVIDYAFGWPLEIEESSGSHRISLSVRLP
ncbi:MAG: hypothetical protein JW803_05340 [Endomicrobiales bacterium]|nr:hypothetical protein [Endomicrobiales bacterium]